MGSGRPTAGALTCAKGRQPLYIRELYAAVNLSGKPTNKQQKQSVNSVIVSRRPEEWQAIHQRGLHQDMVLV